MVGLTFSLTETEHARAKRWIKKHEKKCQRRAGSAGEKESYIFCPTGLGTTVSIQCSCGKEKSLTDWSEW